MNAEIFNHVFLSSDSHHDTKQIQNYELVLLVVVVVDLWRGLEKLSLAVSRLITVLECKPRDLIR